MRAPIALRLFLMVALSMAAVALVGLGLVRWRFALAPPSAASTRERHVVDALGTRLGVAYARGGSWSFLPADAMPRARWWRRQVGQFVAGTGAVDASTSTLADRAALSDARGLPLAGVAPHPVLVALASIDRMRRPILVAGRPVGFLTVARPRDPEDGLALAFLLQQQHQLAWLAAIATALGGLAASLVALGFRRPIRALVAGSRALGDGDTSARVEVRRRDELGDLAATFNALAARLADAEQARRQWVADTSHELRTPLAVLRAQVEALQDGMRPLTRASLDGLLAQVVQLGRLVDDLDALARTEPGERAFALQPLDARQVVVEAWDAYTERFAARGLEATLALPDRPVDVVADGQRLRQVIVNLLENAARHTDRGGKVQLGARLDAHTLCLQLDDSAPGVPEALLGRLGERFFRVDPSRNRDSGGSGLGLALCRQIVRAHGGRLVFAASPLGGLRATLHLRLATR